MTITIDLLFTWLIVGSLAGSLAGMLAKRSRKGFGWITNLGIGMVGAFIGGILFQLFSIDLGLGNFSVSLEDVVSGLAGSLLFLIILFLIRKMR